MRKLKKAVVIFLIGGSSAYLFAQDTVLYPILEKERYGYIDGKGQVVIPAVYRYGGDFQEGLAAVRVDHGFGFIDRAGKWAIAPRFDYAFGFKNGKANVWKNGRWTYIDHQGRTLTNYEADYPGQAEGEEKWKEMKHQPSPVKKHEHLNSLYGSTLFFSCNRAIVLKDGYARCIDTLGNILPNIRAPAALYQQMDIFEGFVAVQSEAFLKAWDLDGNPLSDFPQAYQDRTVRKVAAGRFVFKNEDSWSRQGWTSPLDFLRPPKTEPALYTIRNNLHAPFYPASYQGVDGHLAGGLILVKKDDKLAYVDTNGKVIWQQQHPIDTTLHALNVVEKPNAYWHWQGHTMDSLFEGNPYHAREAGLGLVVRQSIQRFPPCYKSYQLTLYNYSEYPEDTVRIEENIFLQLEAQNDKGHWQAVEDVHRGLRDFGGSLAFLPGRSRTFFYPQYEGSLKVKMRFRVDAGYTFYSPVFEGTLNPSQLLEPSVLTSYRLLDQFQKEQIEKGSSRACWPREERGDGCRCY